MALAAAFLLPACGDISGSTADVSYDLTSLVGGLPVGYVETETAVGTCTARQSSITGGTIELGDDGVWVMDVSAWESGGIAGSDCLGTATRDISVTFTGDWERRDGLVYLNASGNIVGASPLADERFPASLKTHSMEHIAEYEFRQPYQYLYNATWSRR